MSVSDAASPPTEPFLPVEVAAAGWLSPTQAAAALGVSADTVRRMLDAGVLRGARTVLGRVIDPESVKEQRAVRDARR